MRDQKNRRAPGSGAGCWRPHCADCPRRGRASRYPLAPALLFHRRQYPARAGPRSHQHRRRRRRRRRPHAGRVVRAGRKGFGLAANFAHLAGAGRWGMKTVTNLFLTLGVVIVTTAITAADSQPKADAIYVNGHIAAAFDFFEPPFCNDCGGVPRYEAMAIKGDRILAVGTKSDINKLVDSRTKTFN